MYDTAGCIHVQYLGAETYHINTGSRWIQCIEPYLVLTLQGVAEEMGGNPRMFSEEYMRSLRPELRKPAGLNFIVQKVNKWSTHIEASKIEEATKPKEPPCTYVRVKKRIR
jgi:hypothetical protein